MEQNQKETLSKASDATLQQPVTLQVDIMPGNGIERLLMRWGILPKKRVFIIRPITLGNLIRISKLLLCIDIGLYNLKNLLESNYKAIEQHGELIAHVIAIAVHNSKYEPPARLTEFIMENFTSSELLSTLAIVLKQMDVSSFMSSIISVRGLTVLEDGKLNEVSPEDQGSQIALGIS